MRTPPVRRELDGVLDELARSRGTASGPGKEQDGAMGRAVDDRAPAAAPDEAAGWRRAWRLVPREPQDEANLLADAVLDERLNLDEDDKAATLRGAGHDPIFGSFPGGLGRAAILLVLALPYASLPWRHGHAPGSVLLALGGLVLAAMYLRINTLSRFCRPDRLPSWWELGAFVALEVLLVATGGWTWVIGMILVGSSVGYWRAGRAATAVIVGLSVAVGVYAVAGRAGAGGTIGLIFETLVPGLMAQVGAKRHEAVLALIKARRELAASAVNAERLRIARDLHDLLGHSLSVIALKAELAERLVHTDVDRARAELSDVQSVARRSLEEVRQAVEGYRRADLDSELADAREVLTSAAVRCDVDRGHIGSLPAAVDAVLGWAVREATTNILRHSRARHATFRLSADHDQATVEILDDGVGGSIGTGGNGLAGLAERAARLGGRVDHGPRPGGGFRVAVSVPLADR